jgi:chromosome segregation ATPase
MIPVELLATIGIIFVIVLLIILFIPSERRRRAKKKRTEKTPEEQIKEWQGACLKLEKHVQALRQEVETLGKKEKALDKELFLYKEKNKKVQEKLSQERDWQEKEHADVDKKAREIQGLKDEIKRIETNLEKEHSQRLVLEREAKEIRENLAREIDVKRSLDSQILKLKAQSDGYREEIKELRASNQKLSQKHEEKTFVSKSEYEKLEQILKEKEQEIAKLKNQRSS